MGSGFAGGRFVLVLVHQNMGLSPIPLMDCIALWTLPSVVPSSMIGRGLKLQGKGSARKALLFEHLGKRYLSRIGSPHLIATPISRSAVFA